MGYVNGGRRLHTDRRALTPAEHLAIAARHLDDARRHQMEAAEALDAAGAGRPGWHLACATDALDDARALLTERAR